jgi:hypothetical protein
MFTFETDVMGVEMQVGGTFDPGEAPSHDCPGYAPSFEIEELIYKGEELDYDDLAPQVIERLQDDAFEAASNEAEEY